MKGVTKKNHCIIPNMAQDDIKMSNELYTHQTILYE